MPQTHATVSDTPASVDPAMRGLVALLTQELVVRLIRVSAVPATKE